MKALSIVLFLIGALGLTLEVIWINNNSLGLMNATLLALGLFGCLLAGTITLMIHLKKNYRT